MKNRTTTEFGGIGAPACGAPSGAVLSFFLMLAVLFTPIAAFAEDFNGELVKITGEVIITHGDDEKEIKAKVGMKVGPGDTIETMEGAMVEILYDDGNITTMDEDTEITIKELSFKPPDSKKSILQLSIGKIKNSVTKLSNKRQKFAVHTKSGVAGVTGTPPFVISVTPSKGGMPARMEVDLLGKTGDEGGLDVTTFIDENSSAKLATNRMIVSDAAGDILIVAKLKPITVRLRPNTRTVAMKGLPPVKPFKISPKRAQKLRKAMPITTTPEKREEKKKEMAEKIEEVAKEEEAKKEEAKEEESDEEETEEETSEEDSGEETTEEDTESDSESDSEETETESESETTESESETTESESTETTETETTESETTETETTDSSSTETETTETTDTGNSETTESSSTETSSTETSTDTGSSSTTESTTSDSSTSSTTTDTTTTTSAPTTTSTTSGGGMDTSAMMDHVTRTVSVGNIVAPDESETGESTESQISQGDSAVAGAGEDIVPPTTRVRIRVNIINK